MLVKTNLLLPAMHIMQCKQLKEAGDQNTPGDYPQALLSIQRICNIFQISLKYIFSGGRDESSADQNPTS
jgi:hypothetical protein